MPKAKSKTDRADEGELERGRQWSPEETAALLELWASERILAMLDGPKRAAAHIEISETLKLRGILRTAESVTKRMKYLRKRYKDIKDHNMKSGVDRKTAPWFEELDAILGPRPSTEPVFVAQAGVHHEHGDNIDLDKESSDSESDFDFGDVPSPVTTDRDSSMSSASASHPTPGTSEAEGMAASVPGTSTEDDQVPDGGQEAQEHKAKKRLNPGTRKDKLRKKTKVQETAENVAKALQPLFERADDSYKEEVRELLREHRESDERWLQESQRERREFTSTMQSFVNIFQTFSTAMMHSNSTAMMHSNNLHAPLQVPQPRQPYAPSHQPSTSFSYQPAARPQVPSAHISPLFSPYAQFTPRMHQPPPPRPSSVQDKEETKV